MRTMGEILSPHLAILQVVDRQLIYTVDRRRPDANLRCVQRPALRVSSVDGGYIAHKPTSALDAAHSSQPTVDLWVYGDT